MAHYPEAFKNRYGNKVAQDIFKYPYNHSRIFQFFWLARTLSWMFFSYYSPEFIRKRFYKNKLGYFYWADLIVSVGAERINDKYLYGVLFSEYTYAIIKKINKKLVIFPSTFGPFLYGWTTKLFQHVFPKIDLVYARDQESYDICKKLLKTDKNIVKTSDVAIFQSWENKKNEFKKKYNKPIIGISVMKWIYVANIEDTAYSNYTSYVEEMVLLIDRILSNYNVHIILFPTNFPVHGAQGDDVKVCDEIYQKCNRPKDVSYLKNLVSPREFKSMLSASDINIITRMHACILSTSAYVPTIGIAYLFKVKEYMNDIGLGDFCVDIEYFEHKKVFMMFEEMWNRKQEICDNLQNIIENKKVQLLESLNEIDSIILNENPSYK